MDELSRANSVGVVAQLSVSGKMGNVWCPMMKAHFWGPLTAHYKYKIASQDGLLV